ncbi:MAG: HEAT repeat domain-containing protein [Planctomycetota bacterium]|jgi:HEAT repeat protein
MSLLLLLAACGPPRYEGRTAEEWIAVLEQGEGEALPRLASRDAVPVLALIVRSDRTRARLMAIQVLTRLGPDAADAVPALIAALDAPEPGVRAYGALALGRVGDRARDALVRLDRLLADPDAQVRVAAALAVWGIARDLETARLELWRGLVSESPKVRAMAAEAFGELGDEGIDLLILCLADRDPRVRAAAATTLGRIGAGHERARQALEEAAADEHPDVARAAKKALRTD